MLAIFTKDMPEQTGTCKWFHAEKGIGFIAPDSGSADIFVHQSAIQAEGFRKLFEGDKVQFDIAFDEKGRQHAVCVKSIESSAGRRGSDRRRRGKGRGALSGATVLETDTANGVVYRTMLPRDVKAVHPVVARAFFDGEPIMRSAGASEKDLLEFCDMYLPRMAAEGNTILAVDTTTQEILGAFLNEDFCNPDPPNFEDFLSQADGNLRPCMAMIAELEHALAEQLAIPAANRPAGKWFHLWMIGVAPAGRGRGVGKKLAAHSVALARARGFAIAFAECTGAVSTHILTGLGARRAAFCDYASWQGEHSETLRGLPALGHAGMSMMVVTL